MNLNQWTLLDTCKDVEFWTKQIDGQHQLVAVSARQQKLADFGSFDDTKRLFDRIKDCKQQGFVFKHNGLELRPHEPYTAKYSAADLSALTEEGLRKLLIDNGINVYELPEYNSYTLRNILMNLPKEPCTNGVELNLDAIITEESAKKVIQQYPVIAKMILQGLDETIEENLQILVAVMKDMANSKLYRIIRKGTTYCLQSVLQQAECYEL